MKKLFSFIVLANLFLACNNSSDSSTTSTDSSTQNSTNVNNVNGNVPDTNSGMTLNHSLPVDSSNLKDSSNH